MSDKLDQAVFKIFALTHQGQLDWRNKPAPAMWQQATDSVYPFYFEAIHEGRTLALFEERFKRRDFPNALVAAAMGGELGGWERKVHLGLLGENDELMFEFPWSRQLQGLFDAVRYKEANIDDFLDKLLKSEPANEK
ncbi:MAG: hypothetical protein QFF03_24495 [Pseudomonadota bacterium]|nr:hypothetical protein [Pseudomonadota bacterium]